MIAHRDAARQAHSSDRGLHDFVVGQVTQSALLAGLVVHSGRDPTQVGIILTAYLGGLLATMQIPKLWNRIYATV